MVPDNLAQTIFSIIVARNDEVILEAIVDQNMTYSNNTDLVEPASYVDDPQTHFVRMRTYDTYEILRNGKYINSSRIMQEDVTDLIE